jgi:hypothetical protein
MNERLHFINGHTFNHQGASGTEIIDGGEPDKITEWQYANALHFSIDTKNLYENSYRISQAPINYSEDVALEFHLNSFHTPTAHGYEVLILEDDNESRVYANLFLNIMEKHFPSRSNRGIKIITPDNRGYKNLRHLKSYFRYAILTEIFFINNPSDWITRAEASKVINEFNSIINNEQRRTQ